MYTSQNKIVINNMSELLAFMALATYYEPLWNLIDFERFSVIINFVFKGKCCDSFIRKRDAVYAQNVQNAIEKNYLIYANKKMKTDLLFSFDDSLLSQQILSIHLSDCCIEIIKSLKGRERIICLLNTLLIAVGFKEFFYVKEDIIKQEFLKFIPLDNKISNIVSMGINKIVDTFHNDIIELFSYEKENGRDYIFILKNYLKSLNDIEAVSFNHRSFTPIKTALQFLYNGKRINKSNMIPVTKTEKGKELFNPL